MAVRNLYRAAAGIALALLMGCTSSTEDQTINIAANTVTSIFSRQEPARVTITRAELAAAEFEDPFMIARLELPRPAESTLVVYTVRDGLTFWRSPDDVTVGTDNGVIRSTVGVPYDLYGSETAPTVAALSMGEEATYRRIYRHLNALNQLDVSRFWCNLADPIPVTIVILGRRHDVLRFSESCVADLPDAAGNTREIRNVFWRDKNRMFLWKSEQWLSDETGHIVLERIIE